VIRPGSESTHTRKRKSIQIYLKKLHLEASEVVSLSTHGMEIGVPLVLRMMNRCHAYRCARIERSGTSRASIVLERIRREVLKHLLHSLA
jgi:hypothetical protein